MDEKQGLMPTDQKSLLDLDQTYNAITSTEAVKGHGLNVRRAHSEGTTVTRSEDSEIDTIILLMRKPSSGKGVTTSRANVIKPAMTSAQFCIDSNQLVTGGTRSLTEVKRTRANSCGLEFSLPLVGSTLRLEDVSSVTNHHHLSDLSISEKRDFSSARWKKMQIELTMPIHLKFSDVRYKVKCKMSSDNMKYILHGVTRSVDPGEVLALMGPSGGGKTTLINLLSGMMKIKNQDGSITYNDQPYSKWLKRRIGFVLQDDAVLPYLTVRETLTYAALLRLPKALTKQQKEEKAMDVITELGLESCRDTIIGGISGGERKRVCIGNEILLDPSLLFLDEPTSGLDSTTALRIAQMLHGIAKVGKTVVTTIHQPSSRLFNKFDKLILLGKGNSLYFGKASEAMVYFSSIGYSPLIAMNPAEFLIDLANGNINDISIPSELEDRTTYETHEEIQHPEGQPSSVEIHEYLVDAYESKVAYIQKKRIQKPVQIDCKWYMQGSPNSIDVRASWWEQYNILFWRGLKGRRHDYLSYVRVIQVISTAIIIGLLWWHSDTSSPKKLHDQAGFLFFISIFWGFLPVFTSIFTFPQERVMLAKERSVDMYKLSAYFIARNMSDLPLDLILPVVFLLIVYFMVGLRAVFTVFMKTMMTVFLCIVAAQGLGLVIGAAVMDAKKAATLASVIIMTFMLAGGFFIEVFFPIYESPTVLSLNAVIGVSFSIAMKKAIYSSEINANKIIY